MCYRRIHVFLAVIGFFAGGLAILRILSGGTEPVRAQDPPKPEMRIRFIVEAASRPSLFSRGSAVDDQHAWVTWPGSDALRRTVDGGKTWQKLRLHPEDEIKFGDLSGMYIRVYFVTPTRGWLLADSGIWQTEDGGETWRRIFTELASDVQFSDLKNGWLHLSDQDWQQSYLTCDGGQSWQACGSKQKSSDLTPSDVYFQNKDLGWAITLKVIDGQKIFGVMQTKDGGCSWQLLWTTEKINPDEIVHKVYFLNEKEGWLAGEGVLYKSNNGGRDWKPIYLPEHIVGVDDVYFANRMNGWIVADLDRQSYERTFLLTQNGGKTWQRLTDGEVVNLFRSEHSQYQIFGDWETGRLLKIIVSRM